VPSVADMSPIFLALAHANLPSRAASTDPWRSSARDRPFVRVDDRYSVAPRELTTGIASATIRPPS